MNIYTLQKRNGQSLTLCPPAEVQSVPRGFPSCFRVALAVSPSTFRADVRAGEQTRSHNSALALSRANEALKVEGETAGATLKHEGNPGEREEPLPGGPCRATHACAGAEGDFARKSTLLCHTTSMDLFLNFVFILPSSEVGCRKGGGSDAAAA